MGSDEFERHGGRTFIRLRPTRSYTTLRDVTSASEGDVLAILERVNAQGATIVMVTHSSEVAEHASRIVRLADGRVVADHALERPPLALEAAR